MTAAELFLTLFGIAAFLAAVAATAITQAAERWWHDRNNHPPLADRMRAAGESDWWEGRS